MCGIIGIISETPFSVKNDLLLGLKRLEYRGYDSSGFGTREGVIRKAVGHIQALITETDDTLKTDAGIAHTRWATHGGVTVLNSHPHADKDRSVIAVHNGIIENYREMKESLESQGCVFLSQTDTEVIPHFIGQKVSEGRTVRQAMGEFMREAQGTFAILLLVKGKRTIYAMKRDSPLALGIAKGRLILGSDLYAFAKETRKAIFFDDDECAEIGPDSYEFFNRNGTAIHKDIKEFDVDISEEDKESYKHFMIKEILEQPATSRRLIDSFRIMQEEKVNEFVRMIRESKRVLFLSCGTSYHASLVGVWLLRQVGVRAQSVIASEFQEYLAVDEGTLIIPISQSGETMDVVTVLKSVKKKGIKVASIVNVPYSTIQRWSDISLDILAGQEVSVASTKAFTNQVITLLHIAQKLGYTTDLSGIPGKIQETINNNSGKIMVLAQSLSKHRDIFVLGKGAGYPLAREIALKLKEIAYIHAEGMMAGELKHGTIALIEEGTPVISLIPKGDLEMMSSTKEVEARGARTIVISDNGGDLNVPHACCAEFAIYSGIVGHLLAYHIADALGRPIDKPRNLAKSVTVK